MSSLMLGRLMLGRLMFAPALLLAALPIAQANDSAAALAIGGITLTKSESIRMETEDLFLSQGAVRVKYRFTNTAAQDIDTLVAFPLPDHTASPLTSIPDYSELKFTTRIDGQPAKLEFMQRAIFKGRDVTERITRLGFPVMPLVEPFEAAVKKLPKAELEALVKDGLLENIGDPKTPDWENRWVTRTIVTRRQVFPAGRTVSVEHSYVPMPGGSVGGGLNREYRNTPEFAEKRKTYCIDNDFIRAFDARQAKLKEPHMYGEHWLAYVLKTGANWAGPIGDFRLVIDKGDAKNLVSFCGTGVKKISPTQFEVRYQNFTPREDLNVLIVKFSEE